MEQIRKLPIGIQTFDKLREGGFLYVDKTAMIYQIASTSTPYFLSRPRRFGKSLLISTFEAYFQGRKDLFHGLAIEKLETGSANSRLFMLNPVVNISGKTTISVVPRRGDSFSRSKRRFSCLFSQIISVCTIEIFMNNHSTSPMEKFSGCFPLKSLK